MINETVILLTPLEDCSKHRLSEHLGQPLVLTSPFDLYWYKPLQKVFSKVIAYDYPKRQTEIGVRAVNKEVIELVRKELPKYVLWLSAYYEFRESTFECIRREGAIVIGSFMDDEICFDDCSKWWIPYLDYCLTNAIEAVPKYRELGARVILTVPVGGGIPMDRDWSNIEERHEVSFVGLKEADREQYINVLRNRNIPVHVFGKGWGGRVPYEEMRDIFKTSKINLNFSRTHHDNKLGIKGRVFEVCLAGGFLLMEYVPSIENYFVLDKEIVCFKNAEEMIDKVIYYLNHDKQRRDIAQAGWKRAINEYTPFHMLSKVFREIEEDMAARGRENSLSPFPRKLKVPMPVRKRFSQYYFNWGNAFSQENYKGLWKDAFSLSIVYNPFNIRAWLYYIVGFLPYFARRALIRLYKAVKKSLSLGRHSIADKSRV